MKQWFYIGLLMAILFSSCSDFKKGSQLKKLSQLEKSLDSISFAWKKVDTVQTIKLLNNCENTIDSITERYNNQVLTLSVARNLDRFKGCWSMFRVLKQFEFSFSTDLEIKKKSLLSLKQDVSSGVGRREKYDEYIEFEEQEVDLIKKRFESYKYNKRNVIKDYQSTMPIMNNLLVSLSQSSK